MRKQILSLLLVSSLNAGDSFTSEYKDFSKDSKLEYSKSEDREVASICKGKGVYKITISYTACMETILIESKDKKTESILT
jgi:uncharacterized membrane protein